MTAIPYKGSAGNHAEIAAEEIHFMSVRRLRCCRCMRPKRSMFSPLPGELSRPMRKCRVKESGIPLVAYVARSLCRISTPQAIVELLKPRIW